MASEFAVNFNARESKSHTVSGDISLAIPNLAVPAANSRAVPQPAFIIAPADRRMSQTVDAPSSSMLIGRVAYAVM